MKDSEVLQLQAKDLLKMKGPEQLFDLGSTPSELEFKTRMRKLMSHWHPDHAGGKQFANLAFGRIKELYDQGLAALGNKTWGASDATLVFDAGASTYVIRHHAVRIVSGWGSRYESSRKICYVVPDTFAPLLRNWEAGFYDITHKPSTLFAKPGSKEMFEHQLSVSPTVRKHATKPEYLIFSNRPKGNFLNLADVQGKLGTIPIEHVLWITGRLCNLACLMAAEDWVNIDICPDSIYIDPTMHRAILINGWQYAKGLNAPALGAPARTLQLFPELKATRIPDMKMVGGLIKRTALELLGDPTGVKLLHQKSVPAPVLKWYLSPADQDPVKEYRLFEKVRDAEFPKRFVEWDLQSEHIYEEPL